MPQRYVQLCTATGAYDEAIERLESRRFDPWEGERTMRGVYVDAHAARGESLMDGDDHPSALAAFERALDYPVNVGVGKPHQAADSPSLYRAGVACAASGDDARARDFWTRGAAETWHAAMSESGLYAALCAMKLDPAECHTHVGKVRDALAAVPDAPGDVLALLGVAESALGNEDKARAAFEAALRKSPYHLLAARERARLG